MFEQVSENFTLQFSFHIDIVIIDFIKAACMLSWMFRYKSHKAIVTLGDALQSYLGSPDPITHGSCLQYRQQIDRLQNARASKILKVMGHRLCETGPKRFKSKGKRWPNALKLIHWLFDYIL
jgi:hypothetical protein